MINYKQTNLLESNAEALVNTVNLVGVMGKGIALQFRELFPLNYKLYLKACKNGDLQIGKMFVTETGQLTGPRFIINFPTKIDWRSFTKLEYVEKGLDDLVFYIKKLNIKSIAIPPLGCGNGGLDWSIVKPLMEQKLLSMSESVDIEIYEPGHHSYTKTKVRQDVPVLIKPRALILALAEKYNVLGFDISHLELQKLAYFIQELGQPDLKLKFEKGHYGPYAPNLKHLLAYLEGTYFIGQIKFADMKPTDSLKLVDRLLPQVHEYLAESLDSEEKYRLERVTELIEGFESPFGLELLATVHWARKSLGINVSEDKIRDFIHEWSPRKKQNMQENQIKIALQRINEFFA